jgi:2-(1,2-epoxy-1,2-dihydrophenyl)acetyl-CoA isomerase
LRFDIDVEYGRSMTSERFGDVSVTAGDDFVAIVELHRPPNNYFDLELIRSLAEAYESVDGHPGCRAIVLCAEGKHFCAGVDFVRPAPQAAGTGALYAEAERLFRAQTPVVAAVQGATIGGGLGLACSADFRVACPEARFSANFARLGFHHGFALSTTLPAIVGQQHALDLLYTGRRIGGDEAARIGLCDRLVDAGEVRTVAHALAAEIAASAPLAVSSIRATMRGELGDRARAAMTREAAEQDRLRHTSDWAEGVRAAAQRRTPRFEGR